MRDPLRPAPGPEIMIEHLDRLPTEFRSDPTLLFDEQRFLAELNRQIFRAFMLDLRRMSVAAERRDVWSQRLCRRLALVPWVVWATLVAGVELLCLLMAVRP